MMHINNTAHRAVGGAVFKALRTSFLLFLFVITFLLTACEKDLFRYPEIREYHAESQNLPGATTDSIRHFAVKVDNFVVQHPAAKEDPLYPEILSNINKATLTITITIEDEWDGETHISY